MVVVVGGGQDVNGWMIPLSGWVWTVKQQVGLPWTEDSFDAPLRPRRPNDDGHGTYDDGILNML